MAIVTAPRPFPSIFVSLLFLPVPIVSAFPKLTPGLSQNVHGYPLGIVAGVSLAAIFIVLSWMYASLANEAPGKNEEQV